MEVEIFLDNFDMENRKHRKTEAKIEDVILEENNELPGDKSLVVEVHNSYQ